MSKSFAGVTELQCGDGYGCRREAVSLDANWQNNWRTKDPLGQFKSALKCGIHRGAAKRAARATRWSNARPEPTFLDPNGPDFAALKAQVIAERVAANKAAQAAAEVRRNEANLAAQARFAEEWVERSTEAPFIIEPDAEARSYDDRFRAGYVVRHENERASAWDSNVIDVQQDGRSPAIVRIRSNGAMSPAKARAVAQALILAANKADERDILYGPEVAE